MATIDLHQFSSDDPQLKEEELIIVGPLSPQINKTLGNIRYKKVDLTDVTWDIQEETHYVFMGMGHSGGHYRATSGKTDMLVSLLGQLQANNVILPDGVLLRHIKALNSNIGKVYVHDTCKKFVMRNGNLWDKKLENRLWKNVQPLLRIVEENGLFYFVDEDEYYYHDKLFAEHQDIAEIILRDLNQRIQATGSSRNPYRYNTLEDYQFDFCQLTKNGNAKEDVIQAALSMLPDSAYAYYTDYWPLEITQNDWMYKQDHILHDFLQPFNTYQITAFVALSEICCSCFMAYHIWQTLPQPIEKITPEQFVDYCNLIGRRGNEDPTAIKDFSIDLEQAEWMLYFYNYNLR